jgi:hypothetical protein
MNYTFYLPEINKLTSLSQEDWDYLCELAKENNVLPATLASQIIASELNQWRDQVRYTEEMEQRFAQQQMVIDNQIEDLLRETSAP